MTVEALSLRAEREQAHVETSRLFPVVPLISAAIAFVWTLHGALERLYGMTASAWDLAYDQQVIWDIANGHGFYSSFARANFLGIHFELIFVVLAAIEKFWPSAIVLLIFSSAGLAATAPAAYLFFNALLPADRAASRWLALGLAATMPFWASIQEAARDFFHPENMALAFVMVAGWAGLRGHRKTMWAFCLLTLTCKEDQVYTIAVLAFLLRAYGAPDIKKHWRFVLYLAAGWFLVMTGVVQQHFRDYGYTDFVYYRWLIGLDATRPMNLGTFLWALFKPEAVSEVTILIVTLAGLPLLAPRWMLFMVPPYLANVLSGHVPQDLIDLHYILLLMFPAVVAAGIGARRLLERRSVRPAWGLAVIAPALVLAFLLGRFPPGLGADHGVYSRPNQVDELMTATAMIPPDAHVNADDGLAVWLANRQVINDFPDKLDGSCYVVVEIDGDAFISGPTLPDVRNAALAALPSSRRHLLYDDGHFQVWSPIAG